MEERKLPVMVAPGEIVLDEHGFVLDKHPWRFDTDALKEMEVGDLVGIETFIDSEDNQEYALIPARCTSCDCRGFVKINSTRLPPKVTDLN